MPPKAAAPSLAEASKDSAFLTSCFKNLTSKPVVDYARVANEQSMSIGGVKNKLRPILKAMENAGAPWATNEPAAKSAGTPAKRGRQALENNVDGEEAADKNSSRKKRAKAALAPATEEQDGIKAEVKGEGENGTGEDTEDDDEKTGQSIGEVDE